ncbi:hypothetical protein [Streptomyces sp. Ac-502]|uniref:hypothetical protein n=1 Tax=Streptomyces sp. Ac-502 TaxID=3342801 RepID=UPI003862436E
MKDVKAQSAWSASFDHPSQQVTDPSGLFYGIWGGTDEEERRKLSGPRKRQAA